jgi:hypothetical protein
LLREAIASLVASVVATQQPDYSKTLRERLKKNKNKKTIKISCSLQFLLLASLLAKQATTYFNNKTLRERKVATLP